MSPPDLSAADPGILLVDDEPHILVMLEILFSSAGFQTLTAADGFEALERARDSDPAVILLDVTMPRMDGYETCRRLRELAPQRPPHIIMLTAAGQLSDRSRALAAGADDFVTKPFSPSELMNKVETALQAQGGAS